MDSVSSLIGPLRPSVMWMFNHIRREDQEAITKEDLKRLLGVNDSESSTQLDEAFERLDVDEDGQISLEDFMTGFARFLREAPNTPGPEASLKVFDLPPTHAIRYDSARANAPKMMEECYESHSDENCSINSVTKKPSIQFQHSLAALSSHNRHSIQSLWGAIQQSNPELLSDFEGFVGEVAKEVEGAQRALNKQREVTKQEAMQLDQEIQQRLMDVQNKHQVEKAWVQEQTSAKLQSQLAEKEQELCAVKDKLKELECEVVVNQREKHDLAQQFNNLSQEKEVLLVKLQTSERLLTEKRQEGAGSPVNGTGVKGHRPRSLGRQESSELLKIKKVYEDEIADLRRQLTALQTTLVCLSEEDDVVSETEHSKTRPHPSPSPPYHHHSPHTPMLQPINLFPRPLQMENLKNRAGSLPDLRTINQLCPPGATNIPLQQELLWTPQLNRKHLDRGSRGVVSTAEMGTSPEHTAMREVPTQSGVFFPEATQSDAPQIPQSEAPTPQPDAPQIPQPESPHPQLEAQPLKSDAHSIPPPQLSLKFIDAPASKPDYVLKILVVGNSFVGKSSFLMRLCVNAFSQRYSSTIGVDFYAKVLQVEDKVISLQLWDTAGQERFQSVTKAYYRGAHGIILMYDIAQEESFVAVKTWINSIQQSVSVLPAAMLLVGNKLDLDDVGEREVLTETGQDFAKLYGTEFIEASAKTGQNVGNALMLLVSKALQSMDIQVAQKEVIAVTAPTPQQPSSKGCCSR